MKKIIHHIRKQPEHIKRQILYAMTVLSGIVLLFLWIYSLGNNFNSPETQAKMQEEIEPFSILKDSIKLPSW